MKTLAHLIGGERFQHSGATLSSVNPSDPNETIALMPVAGAMEVDAAVAAARAAFPSWASASPEVRADLLDAVGTKLMERRESLSELLSLEEGKVRAEALGEVTRAARIFRYFAGEAIRRHGRTLSSVRPGVDVRTHRPPVGVFALVTPWNFPIAILAWKSAPALAFGNTIVLKPAEATPAIAAALGDIFVECGAPPGIFNLLFGDGSGGAALVEHGDIDGVSFTGSQKTGAAVAAAAARRQIRAQLEMGGKNPLVVLDDADLERAVAIALDGGFFQTGQRCTASSRIIVTEGIHDRFVAALAEAVGSLRVGPALDPKTQVGPAISAAQRDTSHRYVALAREQGGVVAAGGEPLEGPGYFVAPTLIAGTTPDMRINCEEVFGPVVSVISARDYEHALEIANQGDYGLSAGIVTRSLDHARDFEHRIRAGLVMINLATAGVDYHVPFGGVRSSSHGPREQGFAAVEFYTETKTVYVG